MARHAQISPVAALLDALPDPAILLDRGGVVLHANRACEEQLGWTLEALEDGLGRLFASASLGEELGRPEALIAAGADGSLSLEDVELRRRDGSACAAFLRLSALEGDASRILLCLRCQAGPQVRLESFRALFESAEDFVFMKGPDQRYLAVNPSMCRLFGREERELIGRSSEELFPADIVERMEKTDLRVLGGERVEEIHEIPGEDGEIDAYHVIKSPIRNLRGEIVGICGIARVVTENRRLQARIQENEARLRAVTDTLPGVVFSYIRDREGGRRAVYRSSGIEEMIGAENARRLDANEIDFTDLIHPDDRTLTPAERRAPEDQVLSLATEYRLQDGEGGYRWVHAKASGLPLGNGEVQWHGIVLDVQERKQMERELFELSEMLTAVAAQIPGVVYSYSKDSDRSRELIYFSPGLTALIGPKGAARLRADLDSFAELVHPDDRERWRAGDQDLGEGRRFFEVEYRLRRDDGGYRWVHSRANGRRQPDGKTIWNGLILDIDERKRIEAELAETSDRLRSLTDGLPGAVYTYTSDADYREEELLYVSSGIESLVGPKTARRLREERGVFDALIHPDDRARMVTRDFDQSSQRLLFDKRYRLRHDDGRYRWVHDLAYGYPQPGGGLVWHGMLLDIDASKRAEEELDLVSKRMLSISDNLPGMVYSYIRHPDRSRTPIYISQRHLAELVGPENAKRLRENLDTLDDLLHPDDLARIPKPRPDEDGDRLNFEMEYRLRQDRGSYRWVHSRSYGFPRENGDIVWHGFLLDIDDRRRAEEKLRLYSRSLERSLVKLNEAKAQAEQASRAKSRFLANMSHEIRTPLTAVLGFTDLLGDRLSRPENREALEMIRTNGAHLLELINDILDLAKIEAGRFSVRRKRIDPRAELRAAIDMTRPQAEEKGLSLELDVAADLAGEVEGDGMRLRQVFLNLIGNAVKFTSTGSVTVRAFERVDDGAEFCAEVVDTGPGITAEDRDELFGAFVQGEAVARPGGTGLGLAISRELLGLMGGRIEVESEPGSGSCFRVVMPLLPASERSEPDPPSAERAAPALAAHVLLAEDNLTNQRLIEALLAKAGCTLDLVGDGAAAIERVRASSAAGRPHDAVLMDIQMPVLDGLEATRRLRAEGFDLPIVALTAHAFESDRESFLAAGCDEHCSKPIDSAALVATLARLISAHRGRRAAAAGSGR